ncbi:enoyl-CoA hydratase/isomerase family protein [Desulfatibacillum aliphaticivorans]|uniref:enoyl-CoA hydratase/isomerase family protein n=1 Tax=Desulfatibacillum aliphaticivorans TaxID=218208 RepID=UPI000409E2B2|nr:enoyl-CoA hydratase/isomerase family protein [Desulfatibacillum aliphaticivorans]
MSQDILILEMDGDVARITLNRPEVRNALSMELSYRLVEAVETVKRSTKIKFVVFKGAGDTFCAGDDIKEMFRWVEDEEGQYTLQKRKISIASF